MNTNSNLTKKSMIGTGMLMTMSAMILLLIVQSIGGFVTVLEVLLVLSIFTAWPNYFAVGLIILLLTVLILY